MIYYSKYIRYFSFNMYWLCRFLISLLMISWYLLSAFYFYTSTGVPGIGCPMPHPTYGWSQACIFFFSDNWSQQVKDRMQRWKCECGHAFILSVKVCTLQRAASPGLSLYTTTSTLYLDQGHSIRLSHTTLILVYFSESKNLLCGLKALTD